MCRFPAKQLPTARITSNPPRPGAPGPPPSLRQARRLVAENGGMRPAAAAAYAQPSSPPPPRMKATPLRAYVAPDSAKLGRCRRQHSGSRQRSPTEGRVGGGQRHSNHQRTNAATPHHPHHPTYRLRTPPAVVHPDERVARQLFSLDDALEEGCGRLKTEPAAGSDHYSKTAHGGWHSAPSAAAPATSRQCSQPRTADWPDRYSASDARRAVATREALPIRERPRVAEVLGGVDARVLSLHVDIGRLASGHRRCVTDRVQGHSRARRGSKV